jgi:hypothetical protein
VKMTGAPARRAFAVTALIGAPTSWASNGGGFAEHNPVGTSMATTAAWSGTLGFMGAHSREGDGLRQALRRLEGRPASGWRERFSRLRVSAKSFFKL